MAARFLASALLTAVLPASGWAQSYDQQRTWCFEKASPEQKIQGCDAVIKANKEAPDVIATAYLWHGVTVRKLGQNDRALQDYNQAIRLNPGFADAFNSRCYLYVLTNRLQDALKDCNESLRLNPKNQYAYDSRGFAYLKLGMLDASIADYNAALNIEPGRPYSMFGRGLARKRKGDAAGGDADMAAAKAKSPAIDEEFAKYGAR
jgi:tetratricopeptide (TPR) repeat protein